jgi:hypothetical protein
MVAFEPQTAPSGFYVHYRNILTGAENLAPYNDVDDC